MRKSDFNEENYFDGYNESIEKLKNAPEAIELDKLCYAVFESTPEGKLLMKLFDDRFLIPSMVRSHPAAENFAESCIYFEGFKEAFRMIKASVFAHQQRINTEKQKP